MSDLDTDSVRMEPIHCPACGYYMDASMEVGPDGVPVVTDLAPAEGDISQCLRCGELLTFEERGGVRVLTPADLEGEPPELVQTLLRIKATRLEVISQAEAEGKPWIA